MDAPPPPVEQSTQELPQDQGDGDATVAGGEQSAPDTFVSAANGICADSQELVGDLREPLSTEESVDVFAEVVEINAEELARLRELEPPAALAVRFDELLALREDQVADLVTLGAALARGDRDAVRDALINSDRLNQQIDLLELDLGFVICGEEPVEEVPNQLRPPEGG